LNKYPIISCNICHTSENNFFKKYKGNFFYCEEIRQCENCSTVFANPMPSNEELNQYYNKGIYFNNVAKQNKKNIRIFHQLINISRIKLISKFLNSKKNLNILDIGSGSANFGLEISNHFTEYKYDIVEPFSEVSNINKKIINRKFNNINEINKCEYDMIILNFVLEHMIDPKFFLLNLNKILRKDGIIYIEIPNREYCYKDSFSPHLFFWDKESFEFLIQSLNFKIFFCDTVGISFDEAKKYFNQLPLYKKIFDIKYIISRFYNLFFPTLNIKKNPIINNIEKYGGDRNWIRCIIKL